LSPPTGTQADNCGIYGISITDSVTGN
jgi:hypothetical protein